MGQAFGISEDDVFSVLLNKEVGLEEHHCRALFEQLDDAKVEAAALSAAGDLDEQTMAAYEEIWRQLQGMDLVKSQLAQKAADHLEKHLPQTKPGPVHRM